MYIIVNDHGHLVEVDAEKYQEWKDYTQLMYGQGTEIKLRDGVNILVNPKFSRQFGHPGVYVKGIPCRFN